MKIFNWLKNWITHNIWIKFIALILSILTWFYVNAELRKGDYSVPFPKFLAKYVEADPIISKTVPIRPQFKGEPARGFKIDTEGIRFDPTTCKIWGRQTRISNIDSVYILPVDVEDKTEQIITQIPLQPVAGIVLPDNNIIEVRIPIIPRE